MPTINRRQTGEIPWRWALGLSLCCHLMLFGALDFLGRSGLLADAGISQAVAATLAEEKKKSKPVELDFEIEPEMVPTIFVDASPDQATEEKPEETPFYAVIDAVAGDESPEDNLEEPEIDGSQDKVLKTMDTPLPQEATPILAESSESPPDEVLEETPEDQDAGELLNPAVSENPVPEAEGEDSVEVTEGETEEEPEELAMLRPSVPGLESIELRDSQIAEVSPAKTAVRPRTLAQARAQQSLVGEKMKQEGGAKRFRLQSTPDLLATPFGDYDARVIQAIQQRWFDILASMPTARNARGRVVLRFDMLSDGSILGLEIVEDSVGVIQSLVCQKAVSEPAPYGRWPDDMRRMIGKDRREVRFSFFYN